MNMITQQTACDIWRANDEIAKGEKLLEEIRGKLKDAKPILDAFGRQANLSLGIPMSDTSRQLYDVHPNLAVAVIEAHIAEKRSVLSVLMQTALGQLTAAGLTVSGTGTVSVVPLAQGPNEG